MLLCGLHRRGVGIAVGLSSEWSRFEEEEEEERGDGTSLWFSVIMAEEREGRRGSWKRRGEMWEPDYRPPPSSSSSPPQLVSLYFSNGLPSGKRGESHIYLYLSLKSLVFSEWDFFFFSFVRRTENKKEEV